MEDELIKAFLGSGWGSGSGSGSGEGWGSGSGEGSGSGWGSGDGVKKIFGQSVHYVDGLQTLIDHVHGDVARGRILQKDLQTVPCYIVKGNGFFAHGETLRTAREALEEKIMDNMPVKEKIAEFQKKFKPGVKYPAMVFFAWHHFLTGSCEAGRRSFSRDHEIDLDKDALTPEEFMRLTKDAYGGSVILQLMDAWNK